MGIQSKPHVLRRKRDMSKGRTIRHSVALTTAKEAIGPIEPGADIYGLTGGQFSLIDIISHCLDHTGDADVVLSTWTAAGADLDFALGMLADGRIRDMKFIVDCSFPNRQPAYCAALRESFGDDAIRVTKSHCKFVTIRNGEWNLVIRTSMNLNENRRLENFEVSDDLELAEHLQQFVDELFEVNKSGEQFEKTRGRNERDFVSATQGSFFDGSATGRDLSRVGFVTSKGTKL